MIKLNILNIENNDIRNFPIEIGMLKLKNISLKGNPSPMLKSPAFRRVFFLFFNFKSPNYIMNYLNERMPFNAISQCKMEMKKFPYAPKFEEMKPKETQNSLQQSQNYMQSRREPPQSRRSQSHISSK